MNNQNVSTKFNSTSTLLLQCFLFANMCFLQVKGDCETVGGVKRECVKFPFGAIVGLLIAAMVVFIAIPTLICFCCAWACFSGRKRSVESEVHSAQYPQQTAAPTAPNYISAYGFRFNNDSSMFPPPYPIHGEPQPLYQPPPYPTNDKVTTDQHQQNSPPC